MDHRTPTEQTSCLHCGTNWVFKYTHVILSFLFKGVEWLILTFPALRYFTPTMPFPCVAHAVHLPCRAAKCLDCVFPIWFTQCGRDWFTLVMPRPCHARAMPRPCHATTMPFWKRLLKTKAQRVMGASWALHGMCELASAVQRRHVGDLPAFCSFGSHAEFHETRYKQTTPWNCRTRISDISGDPADFHEGHGTVG
jgi:hypothetical protein